MLGGDAGGDRPQALAHLHPLVRRAAARAHPGPFAEAAPHPRSGAPPRSRQCRVGGSKEAWADVGGPRHRPAFNTGHPAQLPLDLSPDRAIHPAAGLGAFRLETLTHFLPEGFGLLPASLLVLASFFTSALTAVFGIGGGVAMLALLGLFVPVAALIPVHGLIQLGSNTGRAWHQRHHIVRGIASPFIVGSLCGVVIGAFFVLRFPDAVLKLALGLFVIAMTWTKFPGAARIGRAGLVAGSALLAFLSMLFGATGPLFAAAFSQLITDDRKALIATQAAGMTVQHALKVIVFGIAGFSFSKWLPFILLMIASGYLGTIYGTRLLERLPEKSFRLWFKIGLT